MTSGILRKMGHWHYTIADYVRLEDESDLKHEFYKGDIRAMTGGTPKHAWLGAAVIVQLGNQLKTGPCIVYSGDLRIRADIDVITYPDASVVCGEVQLDEEDPQAQLNPTVIVEVTSPSSEEYDRGGKFEHYQLIPSLREYVVISHREPAIDIFRRADDGSWREIGRVGPGRRAELASIGCYIDVDELYRLNRSN